MKNLAIALLALAAAPAAHAQMQEGTAYYGLALGEFDYDEGEGGFADNVSAWHVMVGYQFMEHLGVEGGYGKTGSIRDSQTVVVPGLGTFDLGFNSEFSILTVRLLGVLPFDNGVSLLGGLGYAELKQDFDLSINGQVQSGDISGSEPAYYIGAQYDWDRIALRLAYEKYDFSGGIDVNETSLTFFYKL